ncbi:MAG: hypothetical protein R6U63_12030 [Longimicrobiales bacterium]
MPARGGSRGVPGKNLRMLGSTPLIGHVLGTLGSDLPADRIVVSTDSNEIARFCRPHARIHERDPQLATADATLDQVAVAVCEWLISSCGASPEDLLLTVQPTSPFLSIESIRGCVRHLEEGARTVLTVRDDRHLRWGLDEQGEPRPLYAARVNRQQLPREFAETGGVIGAKTGTILGDRTRIGEPVAVIPLEEREALDIDSPADWALAEYYVNRRTIVIRADGGRGLGLGHVHRALALAYELADHNVALVTREDGEYALGRDLLAREPYPVRTVTSDAEFLELLDSMMPDITILDVLDTEVELTAAVAQRSRFLVTIEDLGPGSRMADIVINDLYTDLYPQDNHWYGVQHAILGRPFDQFTTSADPELATAGSNGGDLRVLVSFGGSDEQDLTARTLDALAAMEFAGRVTVVLGPGYDHDPPDLDQLGLAGEVHRDVRDMAAIMAGADLAITSAGRTVTELMVVGVPTLAMCQNMRELRHTHASSPFGVMNLGLGEHVGTETLAEYIRLVLVDDDLRRDMKQRASRAISDRSNSVICRRILERAERKWEEEG